MIVLKTEKELKYMAIAGQVVAEVLRVVSEKVSDGVPASTFDELAEKVTAKMGAVPAFKGYRGYPASICVSVNDEVVHGIPSREKVVKEGDIVSFDFGAIYRGYYADAAVTVPVGNITERARRLIQVTEESFWEAFKFMREGYSVGDISNVVQKYVESHGFSVVRTFVGHGIGKSLHEEPQVPNFGKRGTGPRLRRGMTLAVEPMVNEGHWRVKIEKDGWTARTEDGSLSAHYEHTVVITDGEPLILTKKK